VKDGHPARIRNLQAISAERVLGAPAATIVRNRCHQRLHRATGSTSFAGRPEPECQGLTAVHTRRQTPFHFRVLQGQHPSLTSRVVDASGSWGNAHRKNLLRCPGLATDPRARRSPPESCATQFPRSVRSERWHRGRLRGPVGRMAHAAVCGHVSRETCALPV